MASFPSSPRGTMTARPTVNQFTPQPNTAPAADSSQSPRTTEPFRRWRAASSFQHVTWSWNHPSLFRPI